jgi:hypothetical protein
MKEFEYYCYSEITYFKEMIENKLKQFNEDGWELIDIIRADHDLAITYFFRREINQSQISFNIL